MAMSQKERQRRRDIESVIQVLNSKRHNGSFIEDNEVVDESAEGKFRSLEDIQNHMEGKDYGYLKNSEFIGGSPNSYTDVSIFFISNKNVEVTGENVITYSFYLGNLEYGNSDVFLNATVEKDMFEDTIENFMGFPEGESESNTDETVDDIVKNSDTRYIFNLYLDSALSIMQKYASVAYEMFTGPDVYRYIQYTMPGSGGRSEVTLYVGYDESKNKFRFAYNPNFILRTAIEDYNKDKKGYKSLEVCYVYELAFMITHEMMHIITNNVSSSGSMSEVDLGSHEVENIIEDSFINCKIARMFNKVQGVPKNPDNSIKMPGVVVDSNINVRAEHNVGFKDIKNSNDLGNTLADIFTNAIQKSGIKITTSYRNFRNIDLTPYVGADVYIQVNVKGNSSAIRKSSIIYQRYINDCIRAITDGKIYDRFVVLTTEEKITDKDILPKGSLVRIRNRIEICMVKDYDEESGLYTLDRTKTDSVDKKMNSDGSYTCSYQYSDTGVEWGTAIRSDFIPFDPYENTWVEGAGKEEKTKISDEEKRKVSNGPKNILQCLKFKGVSDLDIIDEMTSLGKLYKVDAFSDWDNCDSTYQKCINESDDFVKKTLGDKIYNGLVKYYNKILKELDKASSGGPGARSSSGMGQDKPVKTLNVGDIVYIRSLNKFGRILSISNGSFKLEEMKEENPRVLDSFEG